MRKYMSWISALLILCMMFSTSAVYAYEGESEPLQMEAHEESFVLDGNEYTIIVEEGISYNVGSLFDETGKLLEKIKYNKVNGKIENMVTDKVVGSVRKIGSHSPYAITDSEGFTYSGSYQYNLGYITSTASLVLAITTLPFGITISAAIGLVGDIGSFVAGYFEMHTDVWRKMDNKYEYVKRYASLYELISGNLKKVAGPTTFLQKKAIDA